MNNKGFTLVEVIAVVAIIALVGLIAAPSILSTLDTGKSSSDRVLYSNIKTAIETMYEEIVYSNRDFYKYDNTGNTNELVTISGDSFSTTIQTLVSNSFLSGTNNNDTTNNVNSRIVMDSNNKDIGECIVSITKIKDGNKVYYEVKGSDVEGCPTDEDLGE